MTIRITGMNSGLDTEALISELVSAYRTKTEKYTKAQTKLSWKQTAWKDLNSKVSSFYSSIRSLKYTSAYNSKKATISDSSVATVTAKSTMATGTYSLKINKVAKSGYLTGAELDSDITESSTLASLGYTDGNGKITVTTGGKTTDISVNNSTTISDFVKSLNDAGVNASYDSANHRIFVAASKSGKDNDFTLTGSDTAGNIALLNLGLSVDKDVEMNVYKQYAAYARNSDGEAVKNGEYDPDQTLAYIVSAKQELGNKSALITNNTAKIEYAKAYQIVKEATDTTSEEYLNAQATLDSYASSLDDVNAAAVEEAYTNGTLSDYISGLETEITEAQEYINNNSILNNDSAAADDFAAKVANATGIIDGTTTLDTSKGAVRIYGQDTEIELNGATFRDTDTEITVNGLTINALTTTTKEVSISVTNDAQGLYDKIKGFIKEYNTLINEMTSLYNADSSKGYEPLTSDEKDAMSDNEVEEWEEKIKKSLLRRDDTLSSLMSSMKNAMFKSYTVNGKSYSLSSFGICTLGVLTAADNEENAFHIDGDSEDSDVSGNTDKLLAALQEDPDAVADFMKQLATSLYDAIGSRMSSTTLSSFGVVYNDKEMAQEYSDYTKTISKWEDKLSDIEDSYYKKFAAMESALATLQSQQSSLASMLG